MSNLEQAFIWRLKGTLTTFRSHFSATVVVGAADLIDALAYINELEEKVADLEDKLELLGQEAELSDALYRQAPP